MKSQFIGIDFDGTVVKYKYPEIGEAVPGCIETLHALLAAGHKLILHTMRHEERLAEAVEYLEANGVTLYGVNENKTQKHWTTSKKVFCNFYIDDCAVNCPLTKDEVGKPYVDWEEVREWCVDKGLLE